MIHVSGVGVLGTFVLQELARRQVPFTWDDTDTPWSAWRVCTGCVLPYDDAETSWYAEGYRFWRDQAAVRYKEYIEPARLFYVLKGAPARMRATKPKPFLPTALGRSVWAEDRPSLQVDIQQLVEDTRTQHAAQRQAPSPEALHIHCRGVLDTDSRPIPLWGWTRFVQIFPKARCPLTGPDQPRVNLHFNDPEKGGARYYFQPCSGQADWWWCGSDRVRQREPRLDPERAARGAQRFKDVAEMLWGQWFEMQYQNEIYEGWRPEERNRDWKQGPAVRWMGGVLVPRPHARNGSQCGPLVASQLVDAALDTRRSV